MAAIALTPTVNEDKNYVFPFYNNDNLFVAKLQKMGTILKERK